MSPDIGGTCGLPLVRITAVVIKKDKKAQINSSASRCDVNCQGSDSAGTPCTGRCNFSLDYLRVLKNSLASAARCYSCLYQAHIIEGLKFLVMNGYEFNTLKWALSALSIPVANLCSSMRVKFELVAVGGSGVEGGHDKFMRGKTYLTDAMALLSLPFAARAGGSETIVTTRGNQAAIKEELGLGKVQDSSGMPVCALETKSTFILAITAYIISIFRIVTTDFGVPMMVVVWDPVWERSSGNVGKPRWVCRTEQELDAAIDACRAMFPNIVHAPKTFDDDAEEFLEARSQNRLSKKRDSSGELPGGLQSELAVADLAEQADEQL